MNQRGLPFLILALLVLTAVVLLLTGRFSSQARAGGFAYVFHVGSLVMAVGEDGSVELSTTDIADPLGAWTIDITYDHDVASVVECLPQQGGVCDLDRGVGSLRVTGASAAGVTRDTVLASITFRCQQEGSSPLSLSAEIGGAFPIGTHVEVEDGLVTCQEAAEPTADPTSTPLPSLPATGGGGPVTGSGSPVASGLLALVGVALVCAGAASRLTRRLRPLSRPPAPGRRRRW